MKRKTQKEIRAKKRHWYPEKYRPLTVKDIAKIEGVCPRTIDNWAKKGTWPNVGLCAGAPHHVTLMEIPNCD